MSIPLTVARRGKIVSAILDYAFKARHTEKTAEQARLFLAGLDDAFGADTMKKIKRLPPAWFRQTASARFNAGGFRVDLNGKAKVSVPFMEYGEILNLKSDAVIAQVQAWAQDGQALSNDRTRLERQLRGLLDNVRTVEAFLREMPEAEPMLKGIVWDLPTTTAVAHTKESILCSIAKARGELREGCEEATP